MKSENTKYLQTTVVYVVKTHSIKVSYKVSLYWISYKNRRAHHLTVYESSLWLRYLGRGRFFFQKKEKIMNEISFPRLFRAYTQTFHF